MTLKIHHLELFTTRCEIAATLNGVPIANVRSTDPHTDHFAPPINPYLVGEGNVLEVSIAPARLENDEFTEWSEAKVEAAVRVFDKGGIVLPGGGGPAITEVDFGPELAARMAQAEEDEVELEVPQSFLHIFDNEGMSFADELLDSEPFDDHDALLDYGVFIRDLFANGDVAGFLAEVTPKCQVWSVAYEEPVDFFLEQIRTGLETEDFKGLLAAHLIGIARAAGSPPIMLTIPSTPVLTENPVHIGFQQLGAFVIPVVSAFLQNN